MVSLKGKNSNAPNFYIAGQSNGNPCLWINGTKNILSTSIGTASQVLVTGDDIYVAGYYELQGTSFNPGGFIPIQCVYWKNGVQSKVGDIINRNMPVKPAIAIVNNNIYYANGQAWVNGTPLNLDLSNSGTVQEVVSYGSDVYFVGTDTTGEASYWKNGVRSDIIPNETKTNADYSIAVSANNLYIGGTDSLSRATIWKNGIPQNLQLTTAGSYATAVTYLFANGTNIYAVAELMVPASMSASIYSNFNTIPAYWKNGIETDLPLGGDSYGTGNSVFTDGIDVYVCGQTSSGAVYWKNGVETKLSSEYGYVSCISIK